MARESRGEARREEGPVRGTEQPDLPPCWAASQKSEESRRDLPKSGTAANLGQRAPSRVRNAQEAPRSTPDLQQREGCLPCRRTGYSEQGRVLGRYRATN